MFFFFQINPDIALLLSEKSTLPSKAFYSWPLSVRGLFIFNPQERR